MKDNLYIHKSKATTHLPHGSYATDHGWLCWPVQNYHAHSRCVARQSFQVPYSRKFSLVQIFAEMHPYPSEEIFAVFIFTERKRDALTTPLPDDGHAPHVCVTEKMTLNNEARQGCATTAYSSLCVEALAITKVSRPRERGRKTGLLNRRIQHCWSRLRQLPTVSYEFVGILHTY